MKAAVGIGGVLHAGFTWVFLLVASWSWIGLVAAELGVYRSWPVAALSVITAVGCAWRMRRSLRHDDWQVPARGAWLLAACIGLATVLFLPPGEYLIDGGDGSVYLNIGRAVARSGGLAFAEPVLDDVDPSLWPRLFERDRAWPHILNLFPGGIQIAPGVNRVQPNFFHLFPIWVANLDAIAGPHGGYYANAIFGVLAIASLWMLGARLSSLTVGTAAAALLAVSFAEIWFARFPTSEVLTQYLVLSGLYFTIAHDCRPTWPSAACAGVAFGLAGLCRLDALVLVSPVVAVYLVLTARGGGRSWRTFALVFAALTLHATVHALVWSRPYTERITWHLAGGWVKPASLVAPAAVIVVAFLWWRLKSSAGSRRLLLLCAGIAAIVVIVRLGPRAAAGPAALLLTTGGLAAGVAGAVVLVWQRPTPGAWLVCGIYAASSLTYLESARDVTTMPMLLRRFVPVILPLTCLLAVYVCSRLSSLHVRLRWLAWAAPAVLAIVLASRSAPVVAWPAMQGVAAQVAALADRLPADAIVLADGSSPSHLGLSLHYTEGRDVLWIHRTAGGDGAIAAAVAALHAAGRDVFLLVETRSDSRDGWLRADDFGAFSVGPAGSASLTYDQIEPTVDRLPSRVRTVSSRVDLYRIAPETPATLPLTLDLGEMDFPWRRDGFHDAEQMGPARARWTGPVANVVLPRLATVTGPLVLRLRLAAPRPAGFAPPAMRVEINGQLLGTIPSLPAAFAVCDLPLDVTMVNALLSGATRLTLRAATFVPAETIGGTDRRPLGVAVDWIRIEHR